MESFTTYTVGSLGKVYLGNNHACEIEGMGTIHLALETGQELVLHDVRYVPRIKKSLLCVGSLDAKGYFTTFGGGSWKIQRDSMLIVKGSKKETLYYLHCKALPRKFVATCNC